VVALKSPREGSTDRLRCLPRRLFEAQGGVVLPTWRARAGFVISDAPGLGCRRREAHDPTLLTLYGVKIPHLLLDCLFHDGAAAAPGLDQRHFQRRLRDILVPWQRRDRFSLRPFPARAYCLLGGGGACGDTVLPGCRPQGN
jgi:hypothetical protein